MKQLEFEFEERHGTDVATQPRPDTIKRADSSPQGDERARVSLTGQSGEAPAPPAVSVGTPQRSGAGSEGAPGVTRDIFEEIQGECERQEEKWGEQNHPSIWPGEDAEAQEADKRFFRGRAHWARHLCEERAKAKNLDWMSILHEEMAEALEQAANGDVKREREELIQCAAVLVTWIRCLDRRGKK